MNGKECGIGNHTGGTPEQRNSLRIRFRTNTYCQAERWRWRSEMVPFNGQILPAWDIIVDWLAISKNGPRIHSEISAIAVKPARISASVRYRSKSQR